MRNVKSFLSKYLLIFVWLAVYLGVGLINSRFLSSGNFVTITRTTSYVMMLALGQMIVMCSGELDFSIGAQATFGACIMGKLLDIGVVSSFWLALALGVLATMALAMISATLIIKMKLPAFITTLAMSMVMDAFVTGMTNNMPLFSRNWPENFTIFKTIEVGPLPLQSVVGFIILIALIVFMEKSRTGRYIYAVGANPTACTQRGISVTKMKYLSFAVCSFCCSFGGCVQASYLQTVPITLGNDYLMTALCACTLSTAFFRPGKYNPLGAFVGTLLLITISNAISNLGLGTEINNITQSLVLLISLALIARMHKNGLPKVAFN